MVDSFKIFPKKQSHQKYISPDIVPWLEMHFPSDTPFHGRFFVACRDGTKMMTLPALNITEMIDFVKNMHISANRDYYITANGVSGVKRISSDLFCLNNIVLDIDCHNSDIPYDWYVGEFLYRCHRDLFGADDFPVPNSIVRTGRGVQFWWALDPASAKLSHAYKLMTSWLIAELEDLINNNPYALGQFAVDKVASRNMIGLFRLPLTTNTKAKKTATVEILHEHRYSLIDMVADYVPPPFAIEHSHAADGLQSVMSSITTSDAIVIPYRDTAVIRGGTTAFDSRLQKLIKLRALRDAPAGGELRDLFCFIVYCTLLVIHDKDEAWARLLAFNAGFREPLDVDELVATMATASSKIYKITNARIIDMLKITVEEQAAINLYPTSERSMARNHTRDTMRRDIKAARNAEILRLFEEGMSKTAIARELGLARNTVISVLKTALVHD